VRDFHWVKDSSCWQLHWPSLNSALIQGRIYFDDCPLTNWIIPINPNFQLNPLCKITGGIGIHGNGVWDPGEQFIYGVRVDLGAGPCPSTGLDHYIAEYSYYEFTVLTPGTYCVSINKQQTVPNVDLPNGLWTEILTEDPVTEITIAFSGGIQTVKQDFRWDDSEQFFVYFELEENTNCRKAPYPDCIPIEIPMKGDLIRLLAQDVNSDWKMAAVNGKECYLYLQAKFNLPPIDPLPPPCPTPTPTPKPKPDGEVNCTKYKNEQDCMSAGCTWNFVAGAPSFCSN
jgi:hypothetical protein